MRRWALLVLVVAGCSDSDAVAPTTTTTAEVTTSTSVADWMAVIAATPHSSYVESATGDDVVTVRLNRGDHREDGIVVGPDGLTDRVVAMEVCFALEAAGVEDVFVLDPLDGELAYRTDRCRLG